MRVLYAVCMTARLDASLIPPSPDFRFESSLWKNGCQHVAGVDEAGRGALAGPVVAAVVVFLADSSLKDLDGVRDSKEMTPSMRDQWADNLRELAFAWGVGLATSQEIDDLGIIPATRTAAQRAIDRLHITPGHILLDYLFLPDSPVPQTSLIKGDARSMSIAAASVIAKTTRDALLKDLDAQYPGYGFARHKGYGTAAHRAAIAKLGPSPIHRLSYKPLLELPNQTGDSNK
jgi:ribonuclease HII